MGTTSYRLFGRGEMMTFGKYGPSGDGGHKSVDELMDTNPKYLAYMCRTLESFSLNQAVRDELTQMGLDLGPHRTAPTYSGTGDGPTQGAKSNGQPPKVYPTPTQNRTGANPPSTSMITSCPHCGGHLQVLVIPENQPF